MNNNMKTKLTLFASILFLAFGATRASAQWVHTPLDTGWANCFAVSGTNLFAGAGGGVFLSTDNGASWTAVGLTGWTVSALAVSGTNLFAGAYYFIDTNRFFFNRGSGVFRSTNNGTSWTVDTAGTGMDSNSWVYSFAVSGPNLFADIVPHGVHVSANNGTSWDAAYTGLPGAQAYDSLPFAVIGTNLFAGDFWAGLSVYLSTNNGMSWTTDSTLPERQVAAFGVIGTNLFAGAGAGGVFLTTNNGTSWTAVDSGLPQFAGVDAFAVSGTNLFAGIGNVDGGNGGGVFLSTNNGTSWAAVYSGLTDTLVYSLAVSGTYLLAGTDSGVWRCPLSYFVPAVKSGSLSLNFGTHNYGADSSLTCELYNPSGVAVGIDSDEIVGTNAQDFSIKSNSKQATLPYQLQPGDSIGITITYSAPSSTETDQASLRVPFAENPDSVIQVTLIGSSKLLAGVAETASTSPEIQSFPNPLTQSTTIRFTSAESGVAQVTVVNLLGEEVARVFEGPLSAGEHGFTWDAKDASPGTYFCIVHMNDDIARSPIILER